MSIVDDALRRIEQGGVSKGEGGEWSPPRAARRRQRRTRAWLWAALFTPLVVGAAGVGGYFLAGGQWPGQPPAEPVAVAAEGREEEEERLVQILDRALLQAAREALAVPAPEPKTQPNSELGPEAVKPEAETDPESGIVKPEAETEPESGVVKPEVETKSNHEVVEPESEPAADSVAETVAESDLTSRHKWYEPGLELLRAGKFNAAVERWSAALHELKESDAERPVLLISAYENHRVGRYHLARLAGVYPLVMVTGWYHGDSVHYLLALPKPGKLESTRRYLAKELELDHIGSHSLQELLNRIEWHERGLSEPVDSAAPAESSAAATAEPSNEPPVTVESPTEPTVAARSPAPVEMPPASAAAGTESSQPTTDGHDVSQYSQDSKSLAVQREARRRLSRVADAIQQGRYEYAAEQLIDIRETIANEHEPWFWSAAAQIGLGNHQRADHFLRQALQRDPSHFESWVQLAVLAQERGEHEKALGYLDEADRLRPGHPSVLLNRAYSNDSLGRAEVAQRSYIEFMESTEGQRDYAAQRQWVRSRLTKAPD